jgi:hypothetical protein
VTLVDVPAACARSNNILLSAVLPDISVKPDPAVRLPVLMYKMTRGIVLSIEELLREARFWNGQLTHSPISKGNESDFLIETEDTQ